MSVLLLSFIYKYILAQATSFFETHKLKQITFIKGQQIQFI